MSTVPEEFRRFPEKWQVLPFSEAVCDVTSGNTKIPQSEYLEQGTLAVVDQGKGLVAGYTDEVSAACSIESPVIVFGDHTRELKFVDFPFALGADGVKVLKPNANLDERFLYHYLRQIELPGNGYSRHFKYLKRTYVPLPPLPEQKRIAAVLDKADEIRKKRAEAIKLTEELLRSAFLEMFGDPVTNPKGWEVRPLNDFIAPERPITYGILKPGPDTPGGVPYIRVVDIKDGAVVIETVRRTTQKIDYEFRRSRLKTGDLLMSIRGHVGRLAMVPPEMEGANITQDTARLAPVGLDAHYLMNLIQTPGVQFWMAQHVRGVAVRGINIGDVRRIPVPVPPKDLQSAYSLLVTRTLHEKTLGKKALNSAELLAGSLTQRAFRGEL